MRRAQPWVRHARILALLAIVPVAAVILAGTLGPPAFAEWATETLVGLASRVTRVPLGYDQVQAAANAVMFAPIGLLLALGLRPVLWPLGVLAGPAMSIGVEVGQRWIPGRVPDGFDVLTNSVGSLAGFLAGTLVVGAVAVATGLVHLARSLPAA